MNTIALIVHTCDRYQLLYQGFEYFFKKYFPVGEVNLDYYILTEEVDYQSDLFTCIKTGRGEWSSRLLNGLKQIPQSHVLYLQEDMWLNEPASTQAVHAILQWVSKNPVNQLKLSSNSVYRTDAVGKTLGGLALARLDNQRSGYLMSHQATIWAKTFLADQLTYNEHPWRNERRGTKRLKKLNPLIYQIDLWRENQQPPCNQNPSPQQVSHYYTISGNAQLNQHARQFIAVLLQDKDPDTKAYALQLQHHYAQKLTHDGLNALPRKDDFFKRLKKRFVKLIKPGK
jgi:hypothetical protein